MSNTKVKTTLVLTLILDSSSNNMSSRTPVRSTAFASPASSTNSTRKTLLEYKETAQQAIIKYILLQRNTGAMVIGTKEDAIQVGAIMGEGAFKLRKVKVFPPILQSRNTTQYMTEAKQAIAGYIRKKTNDRNRNTIDTVEEAKALGGLIGGVAWDRIQLMAPRISRRGGKTRKNKGNRS